MWIMWRTISMHVHRRVVRADWIRIRTLVLKKVGFIVSSGSISPRHPSIVWVVSFLSYVILLQTPANWAWQSIWEDWAFVIRMLGSTSLSGSCWPRKTRSWKARVCELHGLLSMLMLVDCCSRGHWWFLSTVIQLVLQVSMEFRKLIQLKRISTTFCFMH